MRELDRRRREDNWRNPVIKKVINSRRVKKV